MKLADALVYLGVNSDALNKGLDTAQKKTGKFTGNIQKFAIGAAAGVAAGAAAALGAVAVAAFDVAKQTQDATANMAAQLGVPLEKAREYGAAVKEVYANNFGESIADVGDAVTQVAQQFQMAADDPALVTITENAFRMRDAFGVDVNESLSAVRTMMDQFGITSDEAFNLIAAGFQRGLNRSDDFLDTINEYSVQFAEGGASATEFFSALETGLGGGMLGTDKAADLFKEFRVRIQDGSALTRDSLLQLGLDADAVLTGLGNGSLTAADAFDLVQAAMFNVTDSSVLMQAGVGLLGTQFEDLGAKTVMNMDLTDDWAEGTAGALTSIDAKYTTLGSVTEGIGRRMSVSLAPFGEKLLELANMAMPHVLAMFERFDAWLQPFLDRLMSIVEMVLPIIGTAFGTFQGQVQASMGPIQQIIGQVVDFIQQNFGFVVPQIIDFAREALEYWSDWFNDILPLVEPAVQNTLEFIQGVWEFFDNFILGSLRRVWTLVVAVIDTAMKTIGDIIKFALQLLAGDWEGAWQTLMDIMKRLWDLIYLWISTAISQFIAIFTDIDWLSIGTAIMNGIWDGMKAIWTQITDWWTKGWQGITDMLPGSEPKDHTSPLRGLGDRGAAMIENYQAGMESAFANMQDTFGGAFGGMLGEPAMATAGGGGISIVLNINGGKDANAVGRAAQDGVLAALRQAGVR